MINKLKIGLLVMALSLAFGASQAFAVVANLTYDSDTNVYIADPGYTLTIKSGSTLTSLVVNTTSIDIVIPISSTFTLASNNNVTLSGAGGATSTTNTCSGTTNTRVFVTPADSTGTYTITPTGGICNSNAGGGGGGGGSYTPPADTTPPSATSVSINAGAATASTLSSTLTLAATDATQMIISNDAGFAGASWETYATSKAWTLVSGDGVKTVYAKFRDAALNMSTAISDTITVSGSNTVVVVVPPPTSGCSGSNQYNTSTGALCVNNAGAEIPGCGNSTSGFSTASGLSCAGNRVTVSSGTTTFTVSGLGTATLKNGSKGNSVKELQKLLNKLLNLGLVIDGKLGPKTIAVIKTWQKSHGLKADGLVGKLTKAAMVAEGND